MDTSYNILKVSKVNFYLCYGKLLRYNLKDILFNKHKKYLYVLYK